MKATPILKRAIKLKMHEQVAERAGNHRAMSFEAEPH